MKIAQIAPLMESVPPRLYDNVRDPIPYYMLMLDRVREYADEFDILHFHIDQFHFPLFRTIAHRTVTTLHGRQDLHDLKPLYVGFSEMPLVSISNAQRKPISNANFTATVYHGIPTHLLQPTYRPDGNYLAFLGRISPEKRPDRAIRIARALEIPLKIAAKVDKVDEVYFREKIVDSGVTGLIVDTMDEAIRMLPQVLALDRRAVRQRFEQRFSVTRMAKDYV